jgi:hypothetical protein
MARQAGRAREDGSREGKDRTGQGKATAQRAVDPLAVAVEEKDIGV